MVLLGCALLAAPVLNGCTKTVTRNTDRRIARLIAERQQAALAEQQPHRVQAARLRTDRPTRESYERRPSPSTLDVPEGFDTPPTSQPATMPTTGPTSQPSDGYAISLPGAAMTSVPRDPSREVYTRSRKLLTLTDALQYAQLHRRAFDTAQEDLFLATLSLTLERHLWTPQFAGELRTVYGNFGEIRQFDQAMRFVGDLSVSQRLPYGGEFTARAIATLIRDVKKTITASETGQVVLGLNVPFLRGAGHVVQEQLIQLERELTYAVRTYERFRRRQLVDVAGRYFRLLTAKQQVLDGIDSLERAIGDFERAKALQDQGAGTILDTGRAEERVLNEQNRLANLRESFRFQSDNFKLFIGMPIDEPLELEDLESIADIEAQILEGRYPLLVYPRAAEQQTYAVNVATDRRLDLLTARDRIEDAKRGVAIAENAMLPNLDLGTTLTFDTDPNDYSVSKLEFARATWRSELILSMNDRFQERTQLRRARIDVNRARRDYTDTLEQIRVDVRRAINQIQLQEVTLQIQQRQLLVAADRRDFAQIQYDDGLISNRDLVEAETQYINALNALNQAKSDRWSALLDFRIATETLHIDDDGDQRPDRAFDPRGAAIN